jgi:hypothetical protein
VEELPADSRITSRIDGRTLTITLAAAPRARPGCLGPSFSAAAAFAFLAVTCIAQGIFSRNMLWTAIGLLFSLLAGWQLIALGGNLLGRLPRTILEISPESLALTVPAGQSRRPTQWMRTDIVDLRVERQGKSGRYALCLLILDQPAVSILSGVDPAELRWIAGQIRNKWGLADSANNG